MSDEEWQEKRPLWVRLVARKETKRSAVWFSITILGLLAGIGLLMAAIESGSSSLLGAVALPLSLAGACLCAALALWCWLAVRRVDRNSKWP
jgi:hypothetical protein